MRTRFLNGDMQPLPAVEVVAGGFSFKLSLVSVMKQEEVFLGIHCTRT